MCCCRASVSAFNTKGSTPSPTFTRMDMSPSTWTLLADMFIDPRALALGVSKGDGRELKLPIGWLGIVTLMQESPTSTLPPDQLVGGGRNVDLPKQANTQAQDQLDNALEPATKSPVRKAATGGTPGPDSHPDGAPPKQGQVSPHTTPPAGARALNETPPNDGKRPIAKGAAVPSGSDSFLTHLPSIPAFERRGSKKAKARVSPLDSENGNSRAATPIERGTATAAKTPLTGSPVANNG